MTTKQDRGDLAVSLTPASVGNCSLNPSHDWLVSKT